MANCILASRAVSATRYSSTSHLKLQYQIAYTEKDTGWGYYIKRYFFFANISLRCNRKARIIQ